MQWLLRQGSKTHRVNCPDAVVAGHFHGPSGRPLADLEQTVRHALEQPADAPALRLALTPGDTIALVCAPDLPHPLAILAPIVDVMTGQQVELADIQVLIAHPSADRDPQVWASFAERFPEIRIVDHPPDDETAFAYLASTNDGQRVYVNKIAADANVVITVGVAGYDPTLGFRGSAAELFPGLTNRKTLSRNRRLAIDFRQDPQQLRGRQGCEEVGWLSGLFYSLLVNVDRDGAADAVWFGKFQAVQKLADTYTTQHWSAATTEPVDLVVATLAKRTKTANWTAAAAALEIAARLLSPNGTILLVADVDERPGSAIREVLEQDNPWQGLARARESTEHDAFEATQVAGALAAGKLVVWTRIDPDDFELLGVTAITSTKEVENLIAQSRRVFLLEDADRAWAPMAKTNPVWRKETSTKKASRRRTDDED